MGRLEQLVIELKTSSHLIPQTTPTEESTEESIDPAVEQEFQKSIESLREAKKTVEPYIVKPWPKDPNKLDDSIGLEVCIPHTSESCRTFCTCPENYALVHFLEGDQGIKETYCPTTHLVVEVDLGCLQDELNPERLRTKINQFTVGSGLNQL